MDLITEPFDREEQDAALVAALTKPEQTALYLDTSAIVWLYRIRKAARSELLAFLGSEELATRSHLPMWSLHELNRHRKHPKVLFPMMGDYDKLKAAIANLQSNANLFVDDKFAGGTHLASEEAYLKELADTSRALLKTAAPLGKSASIAAIDAELAPFIKSHALKQKLPDLAPLRQEFMARCEGRLPPGYEDASKPADRQNDKEFSGANRFGDFVFWRTIVDHAAQDASIETVVIVSHDAKPDWMYRPASYKGYGSTGPKKGEDFKVNCPQPTLSFEIMVEAGVKRLLIVSITQLIQAFSWQGQGHDFGEMARAIQIETASTTAAHQMAQADVGGANTSDQTAPDPHDALGGVEVGDEAAHDTPQPKPDVPDEVPVNDHSLQGDGGQPDSDGNNGAEVPAAPHTVTARLAALSASARSDGDYIEDAAGNPDADKIIDELKQSNWYVQNPAVERIAIAAVDPETTDDQRFVIGRNLYQAACGNAWRATKFLPTLRAYEAHEGHGDFAIVFAGALFEAYFGPFGARRERVKDQQLDVLFRLAEAPIFTDVVAWFREQLGAERNCYVLVPGDAHKAVFVISLNDTGKPTSISLLGITVTASIVDPEEEWEQQLPSKGTAERLVARLAQHFDIPEERIDLSPPIEEELNFAGLGLIPWTANGEFVVAAPIN